MYMIDIIILHTIKDLNDGKKKVFSLPLCVCMCVCVCLRACGRACVGVGVRVCVRACVCVRVCACVRASVFPLCVLKTYKDFLSHTVHNQIVKGGGGTV